MIKDLKKILSGTHKTISEEGFISFLYHVKVKLGKHELKITEPMSYYEKHAKETLDYKKIKRKCDKFQYKPKISVIIPVFNSNLIWLKNAIESVTSQIYSNWELCMCDDGSNDKKLNKFLNSYKDNNNRIKITRLQKNQGISSASNKAIESASGEFVMFLDHDDEIAPDAIYEIVKALNNDNKIDFLYSDEDKINNYGRLVEPFLKPDFSIHLFRSKNYLVHFWAVRKDLVTQVGGFNSEFDVAQDYDLIFRILEKTNRVLHIKKILYFWRQSPHSGAQNAYAKPETYEKGKLIIKNHLNRLNIQGDVKILSAGNYIVNYKIHDEPYVDILIPTRKISLIKKCVKSIRDKTSWKNYKIWALVNGNADYDVVPINSKDCSELLKITDEQTGLIGPSLQYNWSRMNNIGVAKTSSQYLIFLNDDTEIITENWVEEMLQFCLQPDIGVVGVMLLYPNKLIQHAGDYIAENGMGAHCFNKMNSTSYEVYGLAQVVRETTAVTSACYMVRREVFNELEGYDEELRNFDDFDFCLRIRKKGYKIIYNPFAKIIHYESPTRPQVLNKKIKKYFLAKHPFEKDSFFRYEWRNFYEKI